MTPGPSGPRTGHAGPGLASDGPHIRLLKEKGFRFILGARPGDHELLFSWFEASETKETWKRRDRDGTVHFFAWDRGLPLNDANFDLKDNILSYEGTDTKGKMQRFSCVTELPLGRDTVMPFAQFRRSAHR